MVRLNKWTCDEALWIKMKEKRIWFIAIVYVPPQYSVDYEIVMENLQKDVFQSNNKGV